MPSHHPVCPSADEGHSLASAASTSKLVTPGYVVASHLQGGGERMGEAGGDRGSGEGAGECVRFVLGAARSGCTRPRGPPRSTPRTHPPRAGATHRQYSDMSMPPLPSESIPENTSPSHVQLDSYQSMLV